MTNAERFTGTVTVVICAYTMDRWQLLVAAVQSALAQTFPPLEVVVCIDHNEALLDVARRELSASGANQPTPVLVVPNKYAGRLGSARNTAAEVAKGDILAFLDDDARATPSWLADLTGPYLDESVVAVGGAPHPDFDTARPRWFPPQFDWVFGCAYVGLPAKLSPVRHLIGASMSVRSSALAAIGGFHSDNHDDMDMCHRLAARWPGKRTLYQPAAVVHHFVPAERVTWAYFWRRCFFVNRGKVTAFRNMGEARNLAAERSFVLRSITKGVWSEVLCVVRGDPFALPRMGAIILGVSLGAAGYAVGWAESALQLRRGAFQALRKASR